jgi:hypothetical protein
VVPGRQRAQAATFDGLSDEFADFLALVTRSPVCGVDPAGVLRQN